jgi:hypothetical protein
MAFGFCALLGFTACQFGRSSGLCNIDDLLANRA